MLDFTFLGLIPAQNLTGLEDEIYSNNQPSHGVYVCPIERTLYGMSTHCDQPRLPPRLSLRPFLTQPLLYDMIVVRAGRDKCSHGNL